MNKQRQQLAESIFTEAIGLQTDRLDSFLADRCGDDAELKQSIVSMIELDRDLEQVKFLEHSPITRSLPGSDQDPLLGQKLGAYRLRRFLGNGGMGEVYLGVRESEFNQKAAIKLIRRGMDSQSLLRRFRNEMQFLASLGQHPNITSILDAGTSKDGQHYIAMEYVDGQPINEYCDSMPLNIRQRLQIFCQVGDAVQFAHRNAILHRDLKPNNLLVTGDGQPMLIDFGVGKLVAEETSLRFAQTQTMNHNFTPGYASPEQLNGQSATTASDVYSLGVILYELLAGHSPHPNTGQSLPEIFKSVLEAEPEKPSHSVTKTKQIRTTERDLAELTPVTISGRRGMSVKRLQAELRGDLDRIIMKAIEKDPERRYQTVDQLTDDIQRYLVGKPVKARGNGLRYRVGKYVARNKWAVATATTFVLMLLAGITISTRLAVLANRSADAEREQRLVAEQRERTANEVVELFEDLIASADPRATGNHDFPATQLIEQYIRDLESITVDDPIVQARLQHSLASALEGMGKYREAKKKIKKATRLLSQHLGPEHAAYLASCLRDAQISLRQYDAKWAIKILKESEIDFDLTQRNDPELNWVHFESLINLAAAQTMQKKLKPAETSLEKAERTIRLLASSRVSQANQQLKRQRKYLLVAQGNYEEAQPYAEEDFDNANEKYGRSDYRTVKAANLLATIYRNQQRYEEAIELYANNLRLSREAYDPQHPITMVHVMNLAVAYHHAQRFSDANVFFGEYEAMHATSKNFKGPHYHEMMELWAECLSTLELNDEAEQLLQQCYRFYVRRKEPEMTQRAYEVLEKLVEFSP